MIIPFSIGALGGLFLIATLNRRHLLFILIAIFVSGALAGKVSLSIYATFTGLFLGALTLWILTHADDRVIERAAATYIATLLVWASDNSLASQVIATLSKTVLEPLFTAVAGTFEAALGIGFAAFLAWAILAPRVLGLAEEQPLLGVGYVYLGFSVLSAVVAPMPEYLKLALGLALLPQFGKALRGNIDALSEVAPVLFLIPLEPAVLVTLGGMLAILELAMGILSRKRLLGAAMWATAITLI